MKKLALFAAFLAFLALSSFMGTTEAKAMEPAGHSFCINGVGSPEALAAKIDRSLAADRHGNRKLEGCYATPMHFLVAFQNADPEASLTDVSQLPGYVRKLVATEVDRELEYRASCIYDRANGGTQVSMQCVTRKVDAGEVIYSNPDTGKRVLWGRCANPGFSETLEVVVVNDCLVVKAPSMGRRVAVRGVFIGYRPLPGRCHALRLPGETERRYDFPEECPDISQRVIGDRRVTVVCDWRDVEANSSRLFNRTMQAQNVSYSFYAREDEDFYWYLPPEALEGLPTICWEFPDGTVRTLSVGRGSFVNGVATITEADVRGAVWQ